MENSELEERVFQLAALFDELEYSYGRLEKEQLVNEFKELHPALVSDLNFCFEVLAGKHKLGYTLSKKVDNAVDYEVEDFTSIKEFYNRELKNESSPQIPDELQEFFVKLADRLYRLGYSNKNNMLTRLSPMLAKKYPETFAPYNKYYIQEKLDGNRCIAYCEDSKWHFQSRSGKPLNVNFDMSWAEEYDVFDGEIMTLGKAGSRDFTKTSGAINSKYGDKSQLHYFIYDIVDEDEIYENRKKALDKYDELSVGHNCSILPVIDSISLFSNTEYNWRLDDILDKIVDNGGEGIILRLATGLYEHKRSNNLLKYKKTQTMDLRIVDWNKGQGKYSEMIGSFVCETDDGEIRVNVAGMSDEVRASEPLDWINRIIEVAYFDISVDSKTGQKSLRFPRMKKVRDDKNTTSIY